jgi:hypothetical protein
MNAKWPEQIRKIATAALDVSDSYAKTRGDLNRQAADFAPTLRRAMVPVGKAFRKADADLDAAVEKHATDHRAFVKRSLRHADEREAAVAPEIRRHIAALTEGQRISLLIGDKADRAAQVAVLEAPSYLSGVAEHFRGRVQDDFLARHFPNEVAKFAEEMEAIEFADVAVKNARLDLAGDAFRHEVELETWLDTECQPDPASTVDRTREDAERLAAVDARLAALT